MAAHRLDDDLARIDRRRVHQLGAAMIGPVGDTDFDHAQSLALAVLLDDQREGAEAEELIRRPAQIA